MSWQHYFDRARRSSSPIVVDKQDVGPLPPEFESQGLNINDIWGVYKRQQGLDQIRITELPTQYRVSVSNPAVSDNSLSQTASRSRQSSSPLKSLAVLGIGALGAIALRKARSSQSNSAIDPKQAHRVFISHSWNYEGHFEEVKQLLDDAHGFEYFDHSVSSDDPIDAQLPDHLRKEIRDQMRSTSVVLVVAGMYVAHSDWIQEEIEMANEMKKPIIGVIPGENDRVPAIVQDHATELVEADGSAILDSIERHAS